MWIHKGNKTLEQQYNVQEWSTPRIIFIAEINTTTEN